MASAPFELFRKQGSPTWWIRTRLPSGKVDEFTSGTSSKDKAQGIAEVRVPQKHAISRAGQRRWQQHAKRTDAVKEALAQAEGGGAAGPTPPPNPAVVSPPAAADTPAPSPPPSPREASPGPRADPVAPERAAEIAGRLRALGDKQDVPIEPDEVIPPGGKTDDQADGSTADQVGDGSADGEAADLMADVIAVAVVGATVKGTSKAIKAAAAKEGKTAIVAEPNERMVDWYGIGLRHNLRKLVGNAGSLGPNGKMCVGLAGIVISMAWGTEFEDARPGQGTTTQASPGHTNGAIPRPVRPAAGANGTHKPAPPAPAPAATETDETDAEQSTGAMALGRFS